MGLYVFDNNIMKGPGEIALTKEADKALH